MSPVHESWVDLTRPKTFSDETVPACGEPSPGGRMLCDLPHTGLRHDLGQHLGADRYGNFRGWRDGRPAA